MAKIIVITGAGAGLGRALARRFAKDGDHVILLGRTVSKVQAVADELGELALAIECDVADAESVRAAFVEIAKTYPKIDVLINNAAVYEPFMIAEAIDAQILGPLLTNVAGPIYCARAVIPLMEKGGHIINVSSESVIGHYPMLSLYQSTKAALERFGESLAQELRPEGIRVTTVRAGQMHDDAKVSNWAPEVSMRFGQACAAAGIDFRARAISHVYSVTDAFRAVIDMPADVQLNTVIVQARQA